jgi:methylase of polypeptide subunit release factors
VAELITKWCIRDSSNTVIDPGAGSGTFLVEAYKRLYELKTGKKLEGMAEKEIHEQIIKQLYAIDIDEFACHLTAMNLAMKNIINPSSELNIIPLDFFFLMKSKQTCLTPYKIKTIEGYKERKILIPEFDCIVGNPPYTRWTEIPENTKEYIKSRLRRVMKEYGLTPQVSKGLEPPIYIFWIMHSENFLKENGRLGMIISNLWLQTDYGIKFANYLLDHFKIHAVIDIPLRIFNALTTTTILLLEKEKDKKKREDNKVVFIRLPTSEDVDVKEVLKAIEERKSDKFSVHVYRQGDLSREHKWIRYLFGIGKVEKSDKMVELGELFEVCRGNTMYNYLVCKNIVKGTKDLGSKEFFYFNPSKAKEWEIPEEYLTPAITSSRQLKWFVFRKKDWEELKNKNANCYLFICHKERDKLPDSVKKYIKWGETECKIGVRNSRTKGKIKTANEAESCKVRDDIKYRSYFYGWYDLGGMKEAKILAVYQAWYKTRFALCEFPVVTYHAILCFFPKVELTKEQIKALLAYLNSSFAQFYIETEGRKSGGGIIALEISQAEKMPVLDVRKLDDNEIEKLASLFDKLENEARKIGGASEKGQIEKLKPIIYEIDREIGKILGLSESEIKELQKTVDELIERRISASKEIKKGAIKGEEPIVELREENKTPKTDENQKTLDEFFK